MIDECSQSITYFRSIKSTSKKERISFEQKVHFINEIVVELSKYIEFPSLDLPTELINEYKVNIDFNGIEEIALKLRDYWNLGKGPIKNLSNILLKKGIIISRVELKTEQVDTFSKWIDRKPYIVIGADKGCAVRSRFDLAHELGHIILHAHIEEDEFKANINKIEKEANHFASAFLMPEDEFVKDIYNISLSSFLYLKEK